MADRTQKNPLNVPGRFYVDMTCLDHDWCKHCAPMNFERDDENGYYFVSKQPENLDELERMRRAVAECPVDAIGDDGDLPDSKAYER